ncbi:tetratricopeptide repeat protein [Aureliella helgolandensis]|uniref:Uncharacterized protein n=1 Tax=Aureliella helgolandensis TaxID=2527968 RepID=A0A518G6P1_9BACT|nr:tetratricopeptide repeat protein [Aureliella helgolandensis]QDV24251.1 hypothetical protein Q31a_25660 [Aureliella helgolandensis]
MDPLTPKDHLIRRNPVEVAAWLEEGEPDKATSGSPIKLERFQALEQTLRDHPITVEPYLELAKIYLGSQRWTDARRVLELAISRFDEEEEVHYLLEESQLARSLQLYNQAQQEYASEPTVLTKESFERSRIELNVLRERVCLSRLARHPEQVELYLPLATAQEELENQQAAMESLQKVLQVPSLRASAALQLGELYRRAGQIPAALSSFRRAAMFRVPPPAPEIKRRALQSAADLAEEAGLFDSTQRYLELLLEMSPDDVELQQRMRSMERWRATE